MCDEILLKYHFYLQPHVPYVLKMETKHKDTVLVFDLNIQT